MHNYQYVTCQKGFKCKLSHDQNIQRKGQKIGIYSDKWQTWTITFFCSNGFCINSYDIYYCQKLWRIVIRKTLEKVSELKKPTDIVRSTLSLLCSQSLIMSN
jgi:hypothetical protein